MRDRCGPSNPQDQADPIDFSSVSILQSHSKKIPLNLRTLYHFACCCYPIVQPRDADGRIFQLDMALYNLSLFRYVSLFFVWCLRYHCFLDWTCISAEKGYTVGQTHNRRVFICLLFHIYRPYLFIQPSFIHFRNLKPLKFPFRQAVHVDGSASVRLTGNRRRDVIR